MMPTACALMALLVQSPQDTVKAGGFVQAAVAESAVTALVLPVPVSVRGRRTWVLRLVGGAAKWARYRDRYVEVEGVVRDGWLEPERLRERTPPGAVRRDVNPTFTQRAVVTVALVPGRIAWREPGGGPSGVQPTIHYAVVNRGAADLGFRFPGGEVLCLAVTARGADTPRWEDVWRPERPSEEVHLGMGATARYNAILPEAAAPEPGRYTLRVALCGVNDYTVAVEFEVVPP